MKRGSIWTALGVTAIAVLITTWGLIVSPERALFAYLTALVYWLTIALGFLLLVLLGHALAMRWFGVMHRLAEVAASSLPVLALLFVPLAVGMGFIYPWVNGQSAGNEHAIAEHLFAYLNTPFFLIRAVAYFTIWIVFAELLRRRSLAQDISPSGARMAKQRRLAAIGLPLFALTLTFASVDWVMSLEPHWFSTMFGVYVFSGSFLAALALLAVFTRVAERLGPLEDVVSSSHYYAVGRLMFAFVVFWAYIGFSQFFIIYMGDIPEEVVWYEARVRSQWLAWTLALLVGHFVVPFFALLPREAKRRPRRLVAIALLVLAMHYVDVYWLVMPTVDRNSVPLHVLDVAAWIAVGGITVAFGLWRAQRHSVVAKHHPAFAPSLRYVRP